MFNRLPHLDIRRRAKREREESFPREIFPLCCAVLLFWFYNIVRLIQINKFKYFTLNYKIKIRKKNTNWSRQTICFQRKRFDSFQLKRKPFEKSSVSNWKKKLLCTVVTVFSVEINEKAYNTCLPFFKYRNQSPQSCSGGDDQGGGPETVVRHRTRIHPAGHRWQTVRMAKNRIPGSSGAFPYAIVRTSVKYLPVYV